MIDKSILQVIVDKITAPKNKIITENRIKFKSKIFDKIIRFKV